MFREFCPCIMDHYQEVLVSALSSSIAEFEKLSANVAKHEQEPSGHELQDAIRKIIDNYTHVRGEIEALPICGERSS